MSHDELGYKNRRRVLNGSAKQLLTPSPIYMRNQRQPCSIPKGAADMAGLTGHITAAGRSLHNVSVLHDPWSVTRQLHEGASRWPLDYLHTAASTTS